MTFSRDGDPQVEDKHTESTSPKLRIIPARAGNLADINTLIARSKSYWSWPTDYLEKALPRLVITPDYLGRQHGFEVLDVAGKCVAFCALREDDNRIVLDHLWVTPDRIREGIGRFACDHAVREARARGWRELWVHPDPNAVGFYQELGFSDTGARVPSRIAGGPVFSVYRIDL